MDKPTLALGQYIDWKGKSGSVYRYYFLDTPRDARTIADKPGNYSFVKFLANGKFYPVYFGETESLGDRIPTHERLAEAIRLGATHVMAHTTPAGERARCVEEQDLIAEWNPALNAQHRTIG